MTFEIQIIGLYLAQPGWSQSHLECRICTRLGSMQSFHEAYQLVFAAWAKVMGYEGGDREYMIAQRQCTDWHIPYEGDLLDPSFQVPTFELTIPAGVIVNPYLIPGWDISSQITIDIWGYRRVCTSECCCFKVDAYWNEGEMQSMWVGDPCSHNVDYICPTGCSGGCNDIKFNWVKDIGFFKLTEYDIDNYGNSIIRIHPNPSTSSINFSLDSELNGRLVIKVTDVLGNTVNNFSIDKQSNSIDGSLIIGESSGEYFLHFSVDDVYLGIEKVVIVK